MITVWLCHLANYNIIYSICMGVIYSQCPIVTDIRRLHHEERIFQNAINAIPKIICYQVQELGFPEKLFMHILIYVLYIHI